jgi:hypothetical protein
MLYLLMTISVILLINVFSSSFTFCDWPTNWQLSFQDPASPILGGIINLHHDIFFLLVFIVFFVITIIGLTIYSFNTSKYNLKLVSITKIINNKFLGYFFLFYSYNLALRLKWEAGLALILLYLCLACMLLLYKVFKTSFKRCLDDLKQHSNVKVFLILTELKMKIPFFMFGFYFNPYIFYIMFFFLYAYCIIDFFVNKSLCDSGSVADNITIGPETESTSWGKVGVITALVVGVILGGYFYYKHGALSTADKMAVVKPDVTSQTTTQEALTNKPNIAAAVASEVIPQPALPAQPSSAAAVPAASGNKIELTQKVTSAVGPATNELIEEAVHQYNESVGEVQELHKQFELKTDIKPLNTPSRLKVPTTVSRDFLPTEFAFTVHFEISTEPALGTIDLKPVLKILKDLQVPKELVQNVVDQVSMNQGQLYDITLERKVFEYDYRSKQMLEAGNTDFTFSTANGSFTLMHHKKYYDENNQEHIVTIATNCEGSGKPLTVAEINRKADNSEGYIKTVVNGKTMIFRMSDDDSVINSSQSYRAPARDLFNTKIRAIFFPKIPEADPKYEWLRPNKICALTVAENFEVIDKDYAPYSHNDLVYNTHLFHKVVPDNNVYFKTLPKLYRDFIQAKLTEEEAINAVYSARSKTYTELFPKGYPHPRANPTL